MDDPPPPPDGCDYVWLGQMPWHPVKENCPAELPCVPPANPGTWIGQPYSTDCPV